MNRPSYRCATSLLRTRCTFTSILLLRLLVFVVVVKEFGANKTEFDTIYLRSGQDYQLSCDTKSLDNITLLLWKRQDETLRNVDLLYSSNSDVDARLNLTNVSVANSGVYSCIGYSLSGLFLNHSIEVIVQVIPSSPQNITLISLSPNSLSASWSSSNANESVVLYALYLYYKNNLTAERNLTAHRDEFTFHTLTPHTCYTLLIRALNNVGWSELSDPVHATTLPGRLFIRPPVDLLTVNQTHVTVVADHNKLKVPVNEDASSPCHTGETLFKTFLHGHNLSRYVVSVIPIGKSQDYSPIVQSLFPITNTSKQVMVIGALKPNTQYRLSFTFGSETMDGPATHLNVTTSEGVPDPPVALSGFTTDDSVTLTWSNGLSNGHLTRYKLELYRCTGEEETTVPKVSMRLRQAHIGPLRRQYTFDNLDPNTCFAARVAAATNAGLGDFSSLYQLYTDLPTPLPPHLVSVSFTNSKNILVNWTCSQVACEGEVSSPSPSFVGTAKYYTVCWSVPVDKVVPIGRHYQTPECTNAETFLASATLKSSAFCTCLSGAVPYQTVLLPWSTVQNSRSGRMIFSVRSGIKQQFCCTEGACNSQCFKESADSNVLSLDLDGAPGYWRPTSHFPVDDTIIGGIAAVLALIFVAVLVLACCQSRILPLAQPCLQSLSFCRRGQKASASACSSVNKPCRPAPLRLNRTTFRPIQRDSLCNRVVGLHANDGAGFQAEFEAIDRSTSADLSSNTARLPENIMKNRYSNVLAYDHSRVLLHESGGKTDYINANFVDGYFHRSAYIATQGPIPSTFDDFWSMVWEQECNVIVMISNFIERGRRKCDQYWPNTGCQVYGNISVRMISETVRAFFTNRIFGIRHMKCKRNSNERVIFHYQYTDWRDFDVPATPLPVLKFIENSVAQWSSRNGPIIVHCSAGVGRTGTYICIDSLIQQLKVERCVSVRAYLEHIRQQRMKLVQTEQQFAFIYDALGEFVLNPCHRISPSLLSDHIDKLRALDSSGCSNMEKLYSMCVGWRARNVDSSSLRTLTSHPAGRNSTTTVSATSASWWWSGSSGGLATVGQRSPVLHGHYSLCEYHVARCPTSREETADFWRMVWEDNSPVIVCLLPDHEPASTEATPNHCHPPNGPGAQCVVDGYSEDQRGQPTSIFWPSQGQQSISVDWLQVTFVHSTALSPWLTRLQVLLTSDREDYALSCTLWLFSAWPLGSRGATADEGGDGDAGSTHRVCGEQLLQLVAKCGTGSRAGAHDFSDDEETPFSGGASGRRESVGPVVVVDSCDGHRAGIFCALRIAINQLLDEGYIDIYFVFKMICQQQPGIFKSYHDLELIYTMMQQFVTHHLFLSSSGFSGSGNSHQHVPSPGGGGLAHLLGLPVKHQSGTACSGQDTSHRPLPPQPPRCRPVSNWATGGHCRDRVSSGETSPETSPLLATDSNHVEQAFTGGGHSLDTPTRTTPVADAVVGSSSRSMTVTAPSLQSSQHSSLYSLAKAYLCNSTYSVNSHREPVDSRRGSPASSSVTVTDSPDRHLLAQDEDS